MLPSDFHFLRPQWFWALLPCAILLFLMARFGKKARGFEKLCDPALLPHLVLDKRHQGRVSQGWWLTGLGLLWCIAVTALAGPVWQKQPSPVFHLKTGRVILLDLSPSMEAQDMKPSRLKRAIFKIRDMLSEGREGLTGLVVFGSEPFVVVPLTDDTATIEAMLPALSTGIIPVSGNNAAGALETAADLLVQAGVRNGEIILITDGISDMASTLHQIAALRKKGIRLSVLGAGTEKGAPVPAPGGGFLMDSSGKPEISKLDTPRLEELARAGAGIYTPITADNSDIHRLLSQNTSALSGSMREKNSRVDRWQEQGAWLVLLLLPPALAAFRRGWLLVLVIAVMASMPVPVHAFKWQDLWQRKDQQAWELYEKGKYQDAARLFRDRERQAAALYHAGKYKKASELLNNHKDAQAAYNLGNSLAKAGRLEDAIKAYDDALKLNPDDSDARFNRNLVKKLLEQQKQQNKQKSPNKQDGKSGENTKNKDKNQSGNQGRNQGQNEQKAGASQDKQQQGREENQEHSKQEKAQGNSEKKQNTDSRHRQGQKGKKTEKPHSSTEQKKEQGNRESEAAPAPDREQKSGGKQKSEKEMALEQWLKQIPDDPSGLLRRKFYMEHQRRQTGR